MDSTERNDFYSDRKWCPCCETYVPYLMSLDTSFCARCGGEVRLFSQDDWERFEGRMAARRPQAGRRGRTGSPGKKKRA